MPPFRTATGHRTRTDFNLPAAFSKGTLSSAASAYASQISRSTKPGLAEVSPSFATTSAAAPRGLISPSAKRRRKPRRASSFVAGSKLKHVPWLHAQRLAGHLGKGRLPLGCQGQRQHGTTLRDYASPLNRLVRHPAGEATGPYRPGGPQRTETYGRSVTRIPPGLQTVHAPCECRTFRRNQRPPPTMASSAADVLGSKTKDNGVWRGVIMRSTVIDAGQQQANHWICWGGEGFVNHKSMLKGQNSGPPTSTSPIGDIIRPIVGLFLIFHERCQLTIQRHGDPAKPLQ